jgi:Pyruvate/2-oxoacid:ferredoxin oxidoreductase delta subunit
MLLEKTKVKEYKWNIQREIHDEIKLLMIFQNFVYCLNNSWRATEENQKEVHT